VDIPLGPIFVVHDKFMSHMPSQSIIDGTKAS